MLLLELPHLRPPRRKPQLAYGVKARGSARFGVHITHAALDVAHPVLEGVAPHLLPVGLHLGPNAPLPHRDALLRLIHGRDLHLDHHRPLPDGLGSLELACKRAPVDSQDLTGHCPGHHCLWWVRLSHSDGRAGGEVDRVEVDPDAARSVHANVPRDRARPLLHRRHLGVDRGGFVAARLPNALRLGDPDKDRTPLRVGAHEEWGPMHWH
mmetsp:Transcript_35103/g.89710  ORF Transcript_35103/g.89710 Transcript_35103/m.89710 type:complete len:210 (-) Transcript_35103:2367-2996(-)